MAHDVFISYAKDDRPVADAVCAALERDGVRCWLAHRDIIAGDYGTAIIKAINRCRMFLLVFSSKSNESQQVRREVERAVSKNKIIYPLRIENVQPSEGLEYYISSEQWMDAFAQTPDVYLPRLVSNVKSLLSNAESMPSMPMTPSRADAPSELKPAEKREDDWPAARIQMQGARESKPRGRLIPIIVASAIAVAAIGWVVYLYSVSGRRNGNNSPNTQPNVQVNRATPPNAQVNQSSPTPTPNRGNLNRLTIDPGMLNKLNLNRATPTPTPRRRAFPTNLVPLNQ